MKFDVALLVVPGLDLGISRFGVGLVGRVVCLDDLVEIVLIVLFCGVLGIELILRKDRLILAHGRRCRSGPPGDLS
ncbi:MAG: hypothetical protein BWX71_00590 [Deltaproteobacteria bacterium ADurb.Bin072]|nr:MAG: hypothetical protein BWX71_00590 [Deltaproteobacteria bacterium ADurb.Bin072]